MRKPKSRTQRNRVSLSVHERECPIQSVAQEPPGGVAMSVSPKGRSIRGILGRFLVADPRACGLNTRLGEVDAEGRFLSRWGDCAGIGRGRVCAGVAFGAGETGLPGGADSASTAP